MSRSVLTAAALIACAGLAACVPSPAALTELQARSALDLACPPNMLQLHHMGVRTKAVSGCGRQLVYVEDCQGERACAWRLDSPAAGGFGGATAFGGTPGFGAPAATPTFGYAPPAPVIVAPPAPQPDTTYSYPPAVRPPTTAAAAASGSHRRIEDFGF